MANIPPKNFLLKVLSVLICVHLWFHVSGFPLKQAVLLAGRFDPEMLISKSGSDAASNFLLDMHVRSSRNSMKRVLCVRNW